LLTDDVTGADAPALLLGVASLLLGVASLVFGAGVGFGVLRLQAASVAASDTAAASVKSFMDLSCHWISG
jgi:hypothetical protein